MVVSRDLKILHANKTARKIFQHGRAGAASDLEFSDLPQVLGTKVYQVLRTGTAVAPFKYQAGGRAGHRLSRHHRPVPTAARPACPPPPC